MSIALNRLIEALVEHHQQKVVVLIDEYDKPMLDAIDDIENWSLSIVKETKTQSGALS